MILRLATIVDLPALKEIFRKIVEHMNNNNVNIWDDVYPCEFLSEDIKKRRLYLLTTDQDEIVSAFALCDSSGCSNSLSWEEPQAKALYIERFGVNVDFLNRGFGSTTVKHAIAQSRKEGASYLRLSVVDINVPAINLYVKNGFRKVDGVYEEPIEDFLLIQFGYEFKL